MINSEPILYIFSGLPGTGKSTLAKNIAKRLNAVYIRIDTIEQGIKDLCDFNVQGPEGYRLAYRIAGDNLQIGNNVVTDQCNPINLTRKEWNNVALKHNCKYINIEIICSNKMEHKKRIENRESEIENLKLPSWNDVLKRDYELWDEERIVIDTANKTIEECTKELIEKINKV
jgi:predicted kinase